MIDIARTPKGKAALSAVAGGLVFLAVFYFRYSLLDPDLFQYRDDGVITMSVGKNLVDYGFIGVSPSGPIVEASSSPLQTLTYAFFYFVTGVGYAEYSWVQTYVATFFIGLIISLFFIERPVLAVAISGASALVLSFLYPFFLWHASGMENALTHVLYLLSIYLLYRMVADAKVAYLFVIPVFLVAIVRTETIVHIAILLLFFSIYWWRENMSAKGLLFAVTVGLLWVTFQAVRWRYFGDLLPNTAYAQGISVKDRIGPLLSLDFRYIHTTLLLCRNVFIQQGWWVVLFAAPLFFYMTRTKPALFLISSVGLMFLSISASPFLFGKARIDMTRTTTQLTLLLVLVVFFAIFNTSNARKSAGSVLILLPLSFGAYGFAKMEPYYLGWSTRNFDAARLKFGEIARQNNIQRPTVSNPDLGAMTWHKDFNVVDLGMLGTPEMAKLRNSPALSRYYLKHALPDIIESHGFWTKKYCDSIFLNDEFKSLYEMVNERDDTMSLCKAETPAMRFWIRRDIGISSKSDERRFLNSLQQSMDSTVIHNEISTCRNSRESCDYVARTVYKFIPELRSTGNFNSILDLFPDPADRALLEGWREAKAHEEILRVVQSR